MSFGWASRIGTIGAVAAVLVPFIPELSDQAAELGVPGSVWVWVAALLATVTVIGRMAQAAIATIYSGEPDAVSVELVDDIPRVDTEA